MKHLKRYNDYILNEATADIVFHFTTIYNTISILSDNEMLLSPAIGISADQEVNKGKSYYLSLTTTGAVNTGYANSLSDKGKVRIVFDGRKLKNNLKIGRVDYWQASRQPTGSPDSFYKSHRFNEMEDRVFSDKPSIENINSYINRIDILIEDSEIGNDTRHLKYLADQLGITLNVYTKKDHINLNLRDKAVVVEPLAEFDRPAENNRFYATRLLALLVCKDEALGAAVASVLTNKYKLDIEPKNLTRYDLYNIDLLHSVSADIGNIRSTGSKAERYILDEFFKDLKRNKCKNLKEYVEYKYWLGEYSPSTLKKEILTAMEAAISDMFTYLDNFYSFYDESDNRKPISKVEPLQAVIREKKRQITQYIHTVDIQNEYNFRIEAKLKEVLKLTDEEKAVMGNFDYNNSSFEDILSELENRMYYIKSDMYDVYHDGIQKLNN